MTKPKQAYPTDLNDTEWEIVMQYLPKEATTGRPREHGWRVILNGIFYILRTVGAWRMMPHDLPPRKTVYHNFCMWCKDGTWEALNTALRKEVRTQQGKPPEPSAAILDSQSVKTAESGEERGYDARKKVKGRKRHIFIDTLGLILRVMVTTDNVQDRDGAKLLFQALVDRIPGWCRLQIFWADGGYRGSWIDWVRLRFGWTLQIVEKLGDPVGFQVLPKRWIVECTFSWLNRQRRLGKDYERLPETSAAFIYVAMIRLMLRRLAAANA